MGFLPLNYKKYNIWILLLSGDGHCGEEDVHLTDQIVYMLTKYKSCYLVDLQTLDRIFVKFFLIYFSNYVYILYIIQSNRKDHKIKANLL